MAGFKDAAGRDWIVRVDYGAVERVLEIAGIKLLSIFEPGGAKSIADPLVMLRVIWALCQPQAEKLGVSAEQFKQGLDGDSAEAAGTAIQEAVINFSPSRLRGVMTKLMQKSKAFQAAALTEAETAVDNLEFKSLLPTPSGGLGSNTPASAESTPGLSPSGN